MNSGAQAEQVAAKYLFQCGWQVIDQNWKTPRCEIDIIAKKNATIYFVEVKYRRSKKQGSGLDYITNNKRSQMKFAAELWTQQHGWSGDVALAAIEVTGQDFTVTQFVQDIY